MKLTKHLLAIFSAALLFAGPATALTPQDSAPEFELKDSEGKEVKLSDYKGKVVVLEWLNPECPFVKRHYKDGTFKKLSEKYAGKGVQWLAIDSSAHHDADTIRHSKAELGIGYPVLADGTGEVGKLYGAKTTPHMFVVDASGKLAYEGAIDDDKSGENAGSRVNYVEKALDELLAGKPVSSPQTQPYGCSVKYAG